MGYGIAAAPYQARDTADAEPGFAVMPFWTEEQTPADFLDIVGQNTKARWRQLYREQPPTPPPDRAKAAFILGGLVGDSFLVMTAGDTQQFRNNNQEVLTYSKVLGVGELMGPRLMVQAKMAEAEHWPDLRNEIIAGHAELTRHLNDQMDNDLSILVDLGVWMRVLEVRHPPALHRLTRTPGGHAERLRQSWRGHASGSLDPADRPGPARRRSPLVERPSGTADTEHGHQDPRQAEGSDGVADAGEVANLSSRAPNRAQSSMPSLRLRRRDSLSQPSLGKASQTFRSFM
jgi:hypothetical protein